ncbi:hypothetical protein NTGBS_60031 [Candidatus Nitrotoga sp. BS]|nr:hypothetical protein NTGBS_60031 [Candidatus Nitrotoga sp. BS]
MNGGTGREAAQHPAFRAVNTVLGNLKSETVIRAAEACN